MAKIPHVEVNYEDDLLQENTWQNTANRVFRYMSVRESPVRSNLKRTSNPRPMDLISNFEEVQTAIRKAGYGEYLTITSERPSSDHFSGSRAHVAQTIKGSDA